MLMNWSISDSGKCIDNVVKRLDEIHKTISCDHIRMIAETFFRITCWHIEACDIRGWHIHRLRHLTLPSCCYCKL